MTSRKPAAAKAPAQPRAQDRQVASNPASRAGGKVIVASKLEFPLKLQLQDWRIQEFKDRATEWKERMSRFHGREVYIHGTAFPNGDTQGVPRPQMVNGFALTFNVDEDFFEAWLEQNRDTPYVQGGFVFAHPSRPSVVAESREKKDLKTGFEPLQHGKEKQPNGELADVITDKRTQRSVSSSSRAFRPGADSYSEGDEGYEDQVEEAVD